mmetsp:Transcript_99683/g.282087  ORF Transcript_99683/g.282087 Transcript_99683/m.282087 type:complete len:468 (+) Transcript_99683:393-1796(+)
MLHCSALRLVDGGLVPGCAVVRVAPRAHEDVCDVGRVLVGLQGQQGPVALRMLALEGALGLPLAPPPALEVGPPEHRRRPGDALLEDHRRADQHRVQHLHFARRLQGVPALQDDLADAALRGAERRAPLLRVQGERLLADADEAAPVVLRGAVDHVHLVAPLLQRDLLAPPRGLVPVELAPDDGHNLAVLFLCDLLNSALSVLGPEGARGAAEHGDGRVLLEIPQLFDEAVWLRLVICVEARDEFPSAERPGFGQRPRNAELCHVLDDFDVRLRGGELAEDGASLVLRPVLEQDYLLAARSEAGLGLDRREAIEDELLGVPHRHEPRDQRVGWIDGLRQRARRWDGWHTGGVEVGTPVALGLEEALQLGIYDLTVHALEVVRHLLGLPPDTLGEGVQLAFAGVPVEAVAPEQVRAQQAVRGFGVAELARVYGDQDRRAVARGALLELAPLHPLPPAEPVRGLLVEVP